MNGEAVKKFIETVNGRAIIVAAVKTQPAAVINELKKYGITKAGENRVQELLSKYGDVSGMEWHFIGRLQTNKVKYIIDKVKMIHSVDNLKLADEIEKQCSKINATMDVLIQFNADEEITKGGVNETQLFALAQYINGLKFVRLKGLMCIPAVSAPKKTYENIQKVFIKLKGLYKGAEHLSLGMSNDYETAIAHGANIIRPGTILFGERNSRAKEGEK